MLKGHVGVAASQRLGIITRSVQQRGLLAKWQQKTNASVLLSVLLVLRAFWLGHAPHLAGVVTI